MNVAILGIFGTLFLMCVVTAVANSIWVKRNAGAAAYLTFLDAGADMLGTWVTALILYNNLVPISLYVSLELVKWVQARAIEADPEMRCVDDPGVPDTPALARTSNLNEDLGQVRS